MARDVSGTEESGPRAIVVFGVSGAGKTTVAGKLAERLGADFVDADDHHEPERIAQMASGIPLRDEDRWGWLTRLRDLITGAAAEGRSTVLACSALKPTYRDLMRDSEVPTVFVGLEVSRGSIERRLRNREAHFMPVTMMDSQLATYESLTAVERENGSFMVSAEPEIDAVVSEILDRLGDAA